VGKISYMGERRYGNRILSGNSEEEKFLRISVGA
jgi:hypothetical protein